MPTIQQLGLAGISVKVQSLPTASAETFGAGNRFYTLIGQQEGYITGHTYRTVVVNDVYSWEDVAGGNYNVLDNIPIINQDLTASGFTPVANTYYRHTGTTTDSFTQGVIYLYDTAYHKLGESGGGMTLNKYTYSAYVTTGSATTDSTNAITLVNKILNNAKSYNCNFAGETALPKIEFGFLYLNAIKHISDGIEVFSFTGSANGITSYTTTIKESGVTHTMLSNTTLLIKVTYYNDTEIT